ncbi:MAG: hypothetical protein AAGI24_08670 [Pseudomonadota bacterium]
MHRISQRFALIGGSLCLLFTLLLVLIGSLSSRYQLEQQFGAFHQRLALDLAYEVAPFIARVDLIGLETTLRELHTRHGLQQIEVVDLESRPLGQAGTGTSGDSFFFSAPVSIDKDLAAELTFAVVPGTAMAEQQGMSLGLMALAVLSALVAAIILRQQAQRLEQRMTSLRARLTRDSAGVGEASQTGKEQDALEALEFAIDQLPLELIMPKDSGDQRTGEFREAGLLYIQLSSLARYAETLNEQALQDYTESLRHMIESIATLYGGQLTVAREMGLCVQFSGEHPAGSAGYRAAASGWLLRQLSADRSASSRLSYTLALSCGLGEASADSHRDIYPALYNQPIIDELATLASELLVQVTPALQSDADISNRCKLGSEGDRLHIIAFTEPQADLLERQHQLLLRENISADTV